MENFNITATSGAIDKIKEITADEPPGTNLRVFVQGGGCSGFSYGFTLDSDLTMEDFVCDLGTDIKVVIDSMSAQYLNGSRIDYKDDLVSCNFTIENPNAETSCGCGSSFSPY
jgi:iron-sulfur cluster insertion protein